MADAVFAINHTFQSAAVANANGTALSVGGLPAVGVQVEGITTATVTFEGTIDGSTWYAVQGVNATTGAMATSTTADGLFQVPVTGYDQLRCRISGYSAGTITVSGKAVTHGGASAPVDVVDRIGRLVGKMTNYDVLASGTLGVAQATVELACAGLGTVGCGLSGTWAGTIVAEVEVGDSVWDPIPLVNNSTGAAALSTTANGNFLLGVAGALTLRIRMSAYSSGTATVYLEGSSAGNGVFLSRSIPTGLNSIGTMGLDAGTNNIGRVGSEGITISQTPTVTVGAYSAGDVVGGLLTFANAARVATYGGVIKNVLIVDDAGQDAELELWLFNQAFTPIADNGAWAPAEADLENLITVVSTETSDQGWIAAGTPSICDIEVSRRYDLVGTSMFGQLVSPTDTPTFAATDDITVKVLLLQD